VDAFSAEHLAVLGVTAAVAAGAGLLARRDRAGRRTRIGARALAALLVINEVVFHVVHQSDRGFSARTDLPPVKKK